MIGKTLSTSDTRIEALTLQSSAKGVVIPVVFGVGRVPLNALWYGAFTAVPHTTTQGGKGIGGQQSTTFTYTASTALAVCHGPITGIKTLWRGKRIYSGGYDGSQVLTATETYTPPASGTMSYTVANAAAWAGISKVTGPAGSAAGSATNVLAAGIDYTATSGVITVFADRYRGLPLSITYQYLSGSLPGTTALGQAGLTLFGGELGQATWSYLTTSFASQAIGYSGLAYLAAQNYDLGSNAQLDNHTAEVQGPLAYSINASVPDADPAQWLPAVLTSARYGAGLSPDRLNISAAWSNYCVSGSLLMSPVLTEQVKAAELVASVCKLTNSMPVLSGGRLKIIPLGDQSQAANGRTYTPDITPIYDLTDDDFLVDRSGSPPVTMARKSPGDAYNHVRVEYLNRGNSYNVEVAEARDAADISANGLRSMPVVAAHWFCDGSAARAAAQLILQRSLYLRATYSFTLAATFSLLEQGDIVTLTDAGLGLVKRPVRIIGWSESGEDGAIKFDAEDFLSGIASAPLYSAGPGTGYAPNANAAPGSASTPMVFELPGALTQNGLELAVAASGAGADWGGCNVWVSLTGSNYYKIGTINGASRYGTLSAACTSSGTIAVALAAGTLLSGTAADAAALNTLCFIGGASPEYVAYETATLTGTLAYTLSGSIARGAYGTAAAAHASGAPFARVDGSIARSGPIDLGYVGKTVYIKLTSFNLRGGAEESLGAVSATSYTITGAFVYGNAGASALAGITAAASDNILSAGEKPPIILDYTVITNEQSGLDAQATALGITTEKTAYDNAISALSTYLGGLTSPTAWNNTAGDTTIVGTTFRSTFAAVYAAKQALINKLAAVAATQATWANVTGTGKPQDNATVGAPTGTNVGSTPAATVEAAVTAVNDSSTGLAVRMLSTARNALSGSGGIAAGTLTWNSSGVRTSGYGVGLTSSGLAGYDNTGAVTFAVDASTGAASFSGALSAATGTFAGTLTAAAINAVNTINIADNAVTVPGGASSSTPQTVSNQSGYDDILTVTGIDVGSAGKVMVMASCDYESPYDQTPTYGPVYLQLMRDTTVIFSWQTTGVEAKGNTGHNYLDTPGSGSHTYKLQMKCGSPASSSYAKASYRTLMCIGTKGK